MPNLAQSLHGQDLGHLKIIAEFWGVELAAPDARSGLAQLTEALLDPQLVAELCEALPEDSRAALGALQAEGGRLPWPQFIRRYGELREMGAGRRERQQPHRNPASLTELLWYRGLIGRGFFDTDAGPEEFAYIPDDLLALLPPAPIEGKNIFGRPATPAERQHLIPADDRILDHACTLLAALRMGLGEAEIATFSETWPFPPKVLKTLLAEAELLDEDGHPQTEAVRAFLEASRAQALAQLVEAWRGSKRFNELRQLPHLGAEGQWSNDPRRARHAVLGFLEAIPGKDWWSLPAFIEDIKQEEPDFQRPAGNYDSWYLRDKGSGEYLRGFEHWEQVDGATVAYLICGPLHWLGITDLAAPEEEATPTAFRLSRWGAGLLAGEKPRHLASEDAPIHLSARGQISVPYLTPRAARYQIARFCEWLSERAEQYRYRITPASLERAAEGELKVRQLIALLKAHSATPLPPPLAKALERWERHGTQAKLEEALVLQVKSPEMLEKLRKSPAARFLGKPLGPAAITVKPGAWEKVVDALTELGYLVEAEGGPAQEAK